MPCLPRSLSSRAARFSLRLVPRTLLCRMARIEGRVLAYCVLRRTWRGELRTLALAPSESALPQTAALDSADRARRRSVLGKFSEWTISIAIVMATLLGLAGPQRAHAEQVIYTDKGTFTIPDWAWKQITNTCGEPEYVNGNAGTFSPPAR
jgi:hypothetical protein